ncbi:MAG: hypothetical protein Fur0022_44700 [Anaerolineales bacterium]
MTALNTPEARRAAFAAQQKQWRAQAVERMEQAATRWDKWVLTTIILERFLTRLFSDKLGLLPGWANFLDYPFLILFAVYVFVTSSHRRKSPQASGFGFLILALSANIAISALLNLSRLHPGAFFLFIVGFLEPLVYMLLAYALTPRKETVELLVKVLFLVGWLQIAVVVLMDLPTFFETRNPDFISGTFGENPYQMVFYLLTWNVLILSSKPAYRMRTVWLIGVMIMQGVILAIILLAQFRAIIPFAAITWVITGVLVTRRRSQALLTGVFSLIIFAGLFLAINRMFPELKYNDFFELADRSDEVVNSGKVQAILNFGELISEQPQILVFGAGPGTYASRGFRTFSFEGKGDLANQIYREVFKTDYYITDLAAKYVLPTAELFAFGSATTAVPWFSYLAIPAELGLPGFFLIIALYIRTILKASKLVYEEHKLAVLARWVVVSMVLLLQMAFLENWLENSRLTVPVWVVFGVVLSQIRQEESVETKLRSSIRSKPGFGYKQV